MNKLRKIFSTEVDETTRQKIKALLDKAFAEKWYYTCKHYIPEDPHLPGFITAGPDCGLTGGAAMETCSGYEANTDKYKGLDILCTHIDGISDKKT